MATRAPAGAAPPPSHDRCLAAAYGFGIVSNHPFVDGNKRTGLLAMNAFLALNGRRFEPEQTDEVRTLLALASGEVEEEVLARWIERNSDTG